MTHTNASRVRFVDVAGSTPRERGRDYGAQVTDLIAQSIDGYATAFEESHGLTWDAVTRRAQAWIPLVHHDAPDLLDELEGIAEGSGIDLLSLMVLNARGEIAYDTTFGNEDEDEDGCSSFFIAPDIAQGQTLAGQNWDWRAFAVPTIVMLRITQPGRPTVIMQVEAGQIGRQGANSAGIALNANGLGGRFGTEIGLPQAFIRRMILDSWTFRDALRVPFRVRQQIPANLLISHRDGWALDLETTPTRHRWHEAGSGVLTHANHYEYGVPSELERDYRPFSPDSLYRSPRLRSGLVSALRQGQAPEEAAASALRDHFGAPDGLCRHIDDMQPRHLQSCTVASSIVNLTDGTYRCLIGMPCEHEFAPLPVNLYDAPSAPSVSH